MPEQVTVEQINAHLASGLRRVILFADSGKRWRVLEARHKPGFVRERVMQVRLDTGCGCDEWRDVEPGTRIDLAK